MLCWYQSIASLITSTTKPNAGILINGTEQQLQHAKSEAWKSRALPCFCLAALMFFRVWNSFAARWRKKVWMCVLDAQWSVTSINLRSFNFCSLFLSKGHTWQTDPFSKIANLKSHKIFVGQAGTKIFFHFNAIILDQVKYFPNFFRIWSQCVSAPNLHF